MIEPALGRSCDTCTACCKITAIEELQKPAGVTCSNCMVGVGCRIYLNRPSPCRTFMCGWLGNPMMGPELKPESCHVLIWERPDLRTSIAHADPDRPDAWRAPIVLNFLRQRAREVPRDWKVVAACGRKIWVITEHAILSAEGDVDWFVGYRATDSWRFRLMPPPLA